MMARPARGLGAGAKPLLLASGERVSARGKSSDQRCPDHVHDLPCGTSRPHGQ